MTLGLIRYWPHIAAIALITLAWFYFDGLITDNDTLKRENSAHAVTIDQLNASVKALASANADTLAKLQALASYSDAMQQDAIQRQQEYDSAKTSLSSELATLRKQLASENTNNENLDDCSLNPMPANIIRLLKRPAASYYDNSEGN